MVNNYELEEGQIVLCIVEKILGTTVFVKIDGNGEGTITTSEISPGRIRNLRDYVVPGKKIVCKILSIRGERVHLSLRRVKQSEKKELLEKVAKERSFRAMLKTVLGKENVGAVVEKIGEDYDLVDFFEKVREDSDLLEKYVGKSDGEKILKILDSKKDKLKEIRKKFVLSNKSSEGISVVRDILESSCKGSKCEISYVAAGKYRLGIKGEDFKEIKGEVAKVMGDVEKKARKKGCEFEVLK
ncbi:hypothetical protein HOE04_01075 [archaeon]|jgi:translation initiation factor 2 alpha subunit (eIF-2alpha)|nr:hypothetical protein [archaeon]